MMLDSEFYRLPLRFDADRLSKEAEQFTAEDWRSVSGNESSQTVLPLLAPHGDANDLSARGPMHLTRHLYRCPYLRQVLAELATVLGRTRLVRVVGPVEESERVDTDYYSLGRVSVRIPIVTAPDILHSCNGLSVRMAAGEAWICGGWGRQRESNPTLSPRIHLVVETVGSVPFWELVSGSDRPLTSEAQSMPPGRLVPYVPDKQVELDTEAVNYPVVMSPWEQESILAEFFHVLRRAETNPSDSLQELDAAVEKFQRLWRSLWARHGEDPSGWTVYRRALEGLDLDLAPHAGKIHMPNSAEAVEFLRQAILLPALNPELTAAPGGRFWGESIAQALDPERKTSSGEASWDEQLARALLKEFEEQQPISRDTAAVQSMSTNPEPRKIDMNDTTPKPNGDPVQAPLASVHTNTFFQLLDQLGLSVLVSTYQAGKLIMLRAKDGLVNTHFRSFDLPMGMACDGNRLAIGTRLQVWEYRNVPEVGKKLEPLGKHDACFLPRASHFTGNIRIHEIAWGNNNELWIVNTLFSCLCSLDSEHSFVPRWRPPFVSALALEDRCHLNGLGMVDGQPRYVTALGRTDTRDGWRENKKNGGLLMELPTGKIILEGLSMPHSPRWHEKRLWLLESGLGTLSRVNPNTGRSEIVAELPGFTRGLDFHGPYAFIGLSQVRETAVFSGIPITEKLQERTCGIWVVDIRNGQTVAFVRFESGVQEIFAVQVLPGKRFPDLINEDDELLANSFVLPEEAMKDVAGS